MSTVDLGRLADDILRVQCAFHNSMHIDEERIANVEPVRRLKDIDLINRTPPKRFYRTFWRGLVKRAVSFYATS